MEKRYLFTPGPTPGAARGARRRRPSRWCTTAAPTSARSTSARSSGSSRCIRTRGQVLLFSASGTGAMESAVANLARPGRPGRGRRRRRVRRALGRRSASTTASTSSASTTSGARCPTRPRSARRSRESGAEIVFCTQSETSTGVVADVQAIKAAVGDAIARRRRGLLARRGAARDRRLGDRRRRLRLAEGADVPAGPRDGARRRSPLGRAAAVAQLLLRLARDPQGAGGLRRGVHAGRVADPRPRRRARDDPRRRARGRVRAPRPPRPRDARRHQGDGARALLARRRHLGRGHRGPRARGHRRRRRCCATCARSTASRSRRARATLKAKHLPDRPHRLVRRLRHRRRARRGRAVADRARRRHRARRRRRSRAFEAYEQRVPA